MGLSFHHLIDQELTYFEHLERAWYISSNLFIASIKSFIHGIYPDIFEKSASATIANLYENVLELKPNDLP